MTAPKSLKAFYGARNQDEREISRKNTAKSMISPGERPQDICTPEVFLEPLRRCWTHIHLDPCADPESLVGAIHNFYGERVPSGKVDKQGNQKYVWAGKGMQNDWMDKTFWNPTYNNLKDWFNHADKQRQYEWINLVPVRTHRKWWMDFEKKCDAVLYLKPLKFEGYDQAFPAPLCAMYNQGDNPSTSLDEFTDKFGESLGEWRYPCTLFYNGDNYDK